MTVVVLQHVAVEGPGRVGQALERASRMWRVVRLFDGDPVPVGPTGIDGLVLLGGPMGVADSHEFPHLGLEQDLIADCLAVDVPVLGICLGSQLLAATLGGTVGPSGSLELGWYPTTLTADGAADPVTGQLPPEFVPLHWHGDAMTLPDDATLLASSEQTRVQAFRHGRAAYGMLFHLEADVAQVAAMETRFPDDVARAGSTGLYLADSQLVAVIEAPDDRLFDAWVALKA